MGLNIKEQQMVLDNRRLIHHILQRCFGVEYNSTDYEDLVSIGTIGLIKAASTFDESKKVAFSSYACRCIKNEIFMYYRKAKKYAKDISIDSAIGYDKNGNEFSIKDIIEDIKIDILRDIIYDDDIIKIFSIILNRLELRKKLIILYRMANISQTDIAIKFNCSRSYITRLEAMAIKDIQKLINEQSYYEKIFFVDTISNGYKITFNAKDVDNFDDLFSKVLEEAKANMNLLRFIVKISDGQVTLKVPSSPESFILIAQIVQLMHGFKEIKKT